MEKIHSNNGTLLAIIVPFSDFNKARNEIVPESEFLQGAAIRVSEGDRFRPHKHIWKSFNSQYSYGEIKTQECWVVIQGLIKVVIYDENEAIVRTATLNRGDAVFLLHGGHTFECLEDHTCIWELKTGPYEGQAKDKIFIDGKS